MLDAVKELPPVFGQADGLGGPPQLDAVLAVRAGVDQALAEAKKPTCTVDEITGYAWAKPPASALSKPKPEEPLKVDNHGMDTMRYAVAQLDLVGKSRVQSPARAAQAGTGRPTRAASRYGRSVSGGGAGTGGGRR